MCSNQFNDRGPRKKNGEGGGGGGGGGLPQLAKRSERGCVTDRMLGYISASSVYRKNDYHRFLCCISTQVTMAEKQQFV